MRNILTILFLLISVAGYSQFDQVQTLGNAKTKLISKGLFTSDSGIVVTKFTDTTAANFSYVKNIPWVLIFTTSDSRLWIRNNTATAWTNFLNAVDIALKVNYTDTAAMLANYRHWLGGYTKNSDTASMLSPYINATDTIGRWLNVRDSLIRYVTPTKLTDSLANYFRKGGNAWSDSALLGTTNNKPLYFKTNNIPKMSINGNIINIGMGNMTNPEIHLVGDGSSIYPAIVFEGAGGIHGGFYDYTYRMDYSFDEHQFWNSSKSVQFGGVDAVGAYIGTGSRHMASMFELFSTTQGSIPMPLMTQTQRDAIGSVPEGLMVFNTTTHLPNYYNGSAWVAFGSGSVPTFQQVLTAGSTLTTSNTINTNGNDLQITNARLLITGATLANTMGTYTGTSQYSAAEALNYKTGLRTINYANTNGSYFYVHKDSIYAQPQFGNFYIDSLVHSTTATDKMVVWDSITGKVATRLIPSGGSGTVDTTVIATRDYAKKAADSLDNVNAVSLENPNIGDTLLRVISLSRFQVKSLVDDYGLINIPNDSSVVQRVDTMVIATRDRVKQIADSAAIAHGGGTGGGNLYKDVTTQLAHINNIDSNYATTVTAAGTTTLTANSKYQQNFTGTTTQTIVLPNATTLIAGVSYYITNNSTGVLTVNKNGGTLLQTIGAGQTLSVTVTDVSSSAGGWMYENSGTQITFKKVLAINALKIL